MISVVGHTTKGVEQHADQGLHHNRSHAVPTEDSNTHLGTTLPLLGIDVIPGNKLRDVAPAHRLVGDLAALARLGREPIIFLAAADDEGPDIIRRMGEGAQSHLAVIHLLQLVARARAPQFALVEDALALRVEGAEGGEGVGGEGRTIEEHTTAGISVDFTNHVGEGLDNQLNRRHFLPPEVRWSRASA